MLLTTVLHFHDDILTCIRFAVNIIYNFPQFFLFGLSLIIKEAEVFNHSFALQQIIQKLYQDVFRHFSTEYVFESPIGEGINESTHLAVFIKRLNNR